MKKQVIRLTEGDLHRIIKESVKRILKEEEYPWVEKGCGMEGLMRASQNSIDQDYEYEGGCQAEDQDGTTYYGFVVSKDLSPDDGKFYGREHEVYNIENDDENLVFPKWFKFTYGLDAKSWLNDFEFYATIEGKNYIANWVTGQLKPA